MPRPRNTQLARTLGLIRDLSEARTGVLIADLCSKYGVTRRTLERDMAALEAAGFEVATLPDEEPGRVRKRIISTSAPGPFPATAEELAAARAAAAALAREAPGGVVATFAVLVDRLEQAQPTAARVDADALANAQAFILRPGPRPEAQAEVLRLLNEAILARRRVVVRYRRGGEGEARDYDAEPYGLLYGARAYLVWRGCEDGRFRKLALPFVERVTLADAYFEADPAFHLDDFAEASFGVFLDELMDVELMVLPEGRRRLEGFIFHPSQKVEPNPDGSATVRFRAAGVEELCWHLFSWGASVRVVGPDQLLSAYRSKLTSALVTTGT